MVLKESETHPTRVIYAYPDKTWGDEAYTVRRSRQIQGSAKVAFPPVKNLVENLMRPCGPCTQGACNVHAASDKIPLPCLEHLFARGRTYACVYNINSWCIYKTEAAACFGEDFAPRANNHDIAIEYRRCEIEFWRQIEKHKVRVRERLSSANIDALKKAALHSVGPGNLRVCAFFPEYKSQGKDMVLNRPDDAVVRLYAIGSIRLRGRNK